MHQPLLDKINKCEAGGVFATVNNAGHIALVRLGSYSEVRHRFNQMACLIGGGILAKRASVSPSASHSRAAPAGTWIKRWEGSPVGTLDDMFQLAGSPPCEASDCVGYQAFHGDWPVGTLQHLSGYKAMISSMSEVSNVFYGNEYKPAAQIGQSQDVSAVKRAKEAIAIAKRKGHSIYEEAELVKFLDTLTTARFLHFFHQV
jgi:hypothetical protein